MSKRELDLGRLMAKVARRMEDEGQATSQRLHDWKKVEQVARDSTRGGGNGGAASFKVADRPQDQLAAKMSSEWLAVRVQLEHLSKRAEWLMDQAKAADKSLVRDWTPAQAEAEGWCGHCFKITGELVPITLRPSGEPYYRGRCRFDGSWPGGDPPAEVVRARLAGKSIRVKAS